MKKILTLIAVAGVALAPESAAQGKLSGNVEFRRTLGETAASDSASAMLPGKKIPDGRTAIAGKDLVRKDVTANPEPGLKIWGAVSYADKDEATSMNAHRGFYLIDGEGHFTKLDGNAVSSSPSGNWGTHFHGNEVWVGASSRKYDRYSTSTWEKTGSTEAYPNSDCSTTSSVWYAPEGLVYGFKSDYASEPTYQVVASSPDPYICKVIARPTSFWSAMAMSEDGVIYAVDNVGVAWKCTRSGEITKIGETGIDCDLPTWYGSSGSAMVEKGGKTMLVNLYGKNNDLPATDNGFTGSLYRVDLTTGVATLIVHFTYNDQITAMRYANEALAGVPGAMAPLDLAFDGGSLSGTVGFSLPSVCAEGTPEGDLTWKVYVNGQVAATGTGAWGERVSVPVTATNGGLNYFYAECASAAGTGVGAGEWKFTGTDIPCTPENVKAKFMAGGSMVMVTWNPVTESVNGGYIDPSAITYTLKRYAGPDDTEGEIWKENISITSEARFMAEPERMTDFIWGVTACYDGKVSAEGFSNPLRTGSVVPEWNYGFEDPDDIFTLFTAVNNNSDYSATSQWKYASSGYGANKNGMVQVQINTSQAPNEDWDKWLVSPNMKLIPGKVYEFSIDSKAYRASTTAPQKFEVKLGTSASDMDEMTATVIPVSDVEKTTFQTYKGYLSVQTEGKYYIGVHVCTPCEPASTRNLYFDNFRIGLPQESSAPGQVSELSVVPDSTGAHNVKISFRAPDKDYAGENALQSLDRVEVARGDSVVYVFNHPVFGQTLEFTDTDVPLGNAEYEVAGYNENGKGNPVSSTVYVGVKLPGVPDSLEAAASEDPCKVTLTWTPVTHDADGGNLPEGGLTGYAIVELAGNQQIWLQDVAGDVSSVEITALEEGMPQDFKMYAVFAETESGYGRGKASQPVLVGSPDGLPFEESFDNGYFHHNYMVTGTGTGAWYVCDDNAIGIADCDGNNGFAVMKADYADDCKSIVTGRVALPAGSAPRLAFHTFNITGESISSDLNELEVYAAGDDGTETLLKAIVMGTDCKSPGWNRFVCPLDQWAGQNVQLRFQATARNLQYTMLDGIRLYEANPHDLTALEISVPAAVRANEDFNIRVKVENNGGNTEMEYRVNVMGNGETLFSQKGRTLHPNEAIWIDVPANIGVFGEEHQEFTAEIELEGDGNTDDNTTGVASLRLILPKLPVVEEASGLCDDDGNVELTWNAPVIERTPSAVTDDMEAYEGRSDWMDEWVTEDKDGLGIVGFNGFPMPGAPYGTPHSWFVIDNTDPGFDGQSSFYTHSGSKCLVQMGVEGSAEDWLISPVLSGKAQLVSFWMRAYYPGIRETLEFLVSSKSQNPWDFSAMASYNVTDHNWTEYMMNVPEGTKYFALKATSYNGVMLMVDDISYTPLGNSEVTHIGYNVYRNKTKLNSEPVRGTRFAEQLESDPQAEEYHLTAVYNEGESLPVSLTVGKGLGIGNSLESAISAMAGKGCIIVTGASGLPVSVIAADGKVVFTSDALASDSETVSASTPGVYFVNAGPKVFKLLVR